MKKFFCLLVIIFLVCSSTVVASAQVNDFASDTSPDSLLSVVPEDDMPSSEHSYFALFQNISSSYYYFCYLKPDTKNHNVIYYRNDSGKARYTFFGNRIIYSYTQNLKYTGFATSNVTGSANYTLEQYNLVYANFDIIDYTTGAVVYKYQSSTIPTAPQVDFTEPPVVDDNFQIDLSEIEVEDDIADDTSNWGVFEFLRKIVLYIGLLPKLFWNMFLHIAQPLLNWLGYIVRYVIAAYFVLVNNPSMIFEFIKALPDMVAKALESLFTAITDSLGNLFEVFNDVYNLLPEDFQNIVDNIFDILNFVTDINNTITNFFNEKLLEVLQTVFNINDSITEFIQNAFISFFIPPHPETFLHDTATRFRALFADSFGLEIYDLSDVLGGSAELSDINLNYSIQGHPITATIFQTYHLKSAVASFRPYIRGFFTLLLVYYNINQFFALIRQAPLTMGGDSTTVGATIIHSINNAGKGG